MEKVFYIKMKLDMETKELKTESSNDGFSTLELLGLLEMKKQDILEQIYNPNSFKRVMRNENGSSEEIICKGAE